MEEETVGSVGTCIFFVSSLSPGAHEKLILFGSRPLLLLQSLATESHAHLLHSCVLYRDPGRLMNHFCVFT